MWRELIHRRSVWLAALILLTGLQAARLVYQARLETQTVDEGIHIATGYTFLKSGDYGLDKEHPPLARLVCALPLWWIGADARLDAPTWRDKWMIEHGRTVVFEQKGISPERVMLAARLGAIALALLLTLSVALWTRSRFGATAGWLALLLVSLDPNLNANGHLATTDMAAALTCFLACAAFERMLRAPGRWNVALAGLALGAALSSKHSMAFLAPAFLLLFLARTPWKRALAHFAGMAAVAAAVVLAAYGPETLRSLEAPPLQRQVPEGGPLNDALILAGRRLGVPAHPYLVGLGTLGAHQEKGHAAYLLGEPYTGGKWQFFPVAFLAKAPLGSLFLILLSLPLLRRAPRAEWLVLAVPVVLYWGLSIQGGINIGLRHLLPVYPLTFALAAGLLGRHAASLYGRAAVALMLAGCGALTAESARIVPHDLAFFNAAAGGPERGPEILVDSSIDWGQSLGELRTWLGAASPDKVCLVYFGTAPREHYGFNSCALPPTNEIRSGVKLERPLAAISVTLLEGVYHKREWYGWLRERQPVARIGYSIYVYDVRDLLREDLR